MEKMNIIDILRDCPEGTKLYSLVHGEVELKRVGVEDIYCKPNYLNHELSFNSDGRWVKNQGECILFPSKENRDWSTFQRPFKDGDVVAVTIIPEGTWIGIFKQYKETSFESYCCFNTIGVFHSTGFRNYLHTDLRLATEEEKQKLFNAIKDNGYKWNLETKTLEKLIVPKFKVGDRIKNKYIHKNYYAPEYTIIKVYAEDYKTDFGILPFENQDNYELVPNKFDISTLKPFDKVLVRAYNSFWRIGFFEKIEKKNKRYPFVCMGYNKYSQCIPFEGNEHLLGTTDDCDEYYKIWE